MHIIWAGPLVSDIALREKHSTNQAEAKWSRGLLRGLREIGCSIDVVTHCPEQCWPRGRVFWQNSDAKWFLDEFPAVCIGYPNWPLVREKYLCGAYARAVRQIMARKKVDAVICYNSMHVYHMAALREGQSLGATAVPIILDAGLGKTSPLDDNWATMLRDNHGSNGLVFLSYWCCQHYPDRAVPILHMDGGSDGFKGTDPGMRALGEPVHIVYTGAIDTTRGARFLAKVICLLRGQNMRFTICGKGSERFRALLPIDEARVEIKGFVSDDELNTICRSADMFVSMRESDYGLNLFNYPSKIPNYLSWGRPIVSTWLESFSPDYRDVLCVADENTPASFAEKIREVAAWDAKTYLRHFACVRSWYLARKVWKTQAERLVSFVRSLRAPE